MLSFSDGERPLFCDPPGRTVRMRPKSPSEGLLFGKPRHFLPMDPFVSLKGGIFGRPRDGPGGLARRRPSGLARRRPSSFGRPCAMASGPPRGRHVSGGSAFRSITARSCDAIPARQPLAARFARPLQISPTAPPQAVCPSVTHRPCTDWAYLVVHCSFPIIRIQDIDFFQNVLQSLSISCG